MLAALTDGRLILAILVLMAAEGVLLALLWQKRALGLPWRGFLGNLLSGAALMMAVRAAVLDRSGTEIAGWLLAALVAHLIDLYWRWGRPQSGGTPAAPDNR